MLGRKLAGSASFVCLRCRLQLASAPSTRVPFAAASTALSSRPSFQRHIGSHSSSTGAHDPKSEIGAEIDDDASPEPRAEPEDDTAGHKEGFSIIPSPPSAPPPPPRNRTLYTSRGHILAPEQEGLSIDILGKPGSAIVLREKRAVARKRRLPKLASEPSTNTPVDPTSLLSDENAADASDDALLNIHELKPNDTRVLSDNHFNKLKNTLVEGFTNAQLAHYIGEYQRIRRLSQEDESISEVAPWVVERRPWVPFVDGPVGAADPLLEGYITKAMTPKKRLAIRIMRECWDLSNQKVIERDGYLDIRLRDAEFSLLTLGSRRWLEGTPRAILSRVKQVKLTRDTRSVSIMAPRHAAETILDRINEVLSKTRTSDFPVDLISPSLLDPNVLEEVGRMTNTLTRLDASGKKVVVTWIHMSERDEELENAGEVVFRFLRDAYGPKARMSTTLSVVPDDLVQEGRYLPMLSSAQKLPWQERFATWERWTAAISQNKMATQALAQESLIPANILPFTILAIEDLESSVDGTPGWSSQLYTHTSAVFGHVVFARQNPRPSFPVPAAGSTSQLDTSLRRTFVPAIPALGCLNLPSNLRENGLWHTTILIRFSPSPDISPDLIASAPTLELRVEADHKEIKSLTSLRAIKDTFAGDVLFPAAPVDSRLIQQRYFALPGPSIEHHVPSIIDFLSKSDLRPQEGKLNTPPVLPGVRLPRRLLHSYPRITNYITPAPPTPKEDSQDPVEIPYNLTAIEVHRTVTAEYEGLKLRYTSIQAGQRGGERSELSLDAVRVDPQDVEDAVAALEAEEEAAQGEDSAPRALDKYAIVDEATFRAEFGFDTVNDTNKVPKRRPSIPAKPAKLQDFIRVASGIVNEQGSLRWHAKRS